MGRVPAPPHRDKRLETAVDGLERWRPELSARRPLWPAQAIALAGAISSLTILTVAVGETAEAVLTWLLALPFLVSALIRVWALGMVRLSRQKSVPPNEPPAVSDTPLPTYTILVPLYREEGVAPQIVEALLALDYPTDRLQVLIIVEASDPCTPATILAKRPLPPHMRFVVVPDGTPRTKPRALNYALAEATGEFVVVYDAEDIPEPDQLRRAAAAFVRDPGIGCLQARLNIYNACESWLTRGIA